MESYDTNLHDAAIEQQCTKCKEYESNEEAYGIALLVLAFIGPIIGILIGLFAGKKLLDK